MKIAFYLPRVYLKPGGGAKIVLEYANYLQKREDCQVSIYYFSRGNQVNESIKSKIRVIADKILGNKIGAKKWFPLDDNICQKVIDNVCEIDDVDIVIATAVQLVEPIYERFYRKSKMIYLIQGFETWAMDEQRLYDIYNLDIEKIVISSWLKDIVDANAKKKSILIPNGINNEVFYNFNQKREKHSIVFQYRTTEIKGGTYALQVIERLYEIYPDLKVYIISRERRNFELMPCCKYLYNLQPEQVAEVNNKAEIFMCTTIEEGFGLPGLEAMACGCVLVSTDYEAVHDYATDGVNCLLSPIRDVNAMVENIVHLFEEPSLMQKLAKNAIETGIHRTKEKSLDLVEKTIRRIYHEL